MRRRKQLEPLDAKSCMFTLAVFVGLVGLSALMTWGIVWGMDRADQNWRAQCLAVGGDSLRYYGRGGVVCIDSTKRIIDSAFTR